METQSGGGAEVPFISLEGGSSREKRESMRYPKRDH